jgi:hypothetical protein
VSQTDEIIPEDVKDVIIWKSTEGAGDFLKTIQYENDRGFVGTVNLNPAHKERLQKAYLVLHFGE